MVSLSLPDLSTTRTSFGDPCPNGANSDGHCPTTSTVRDESRIGPGTVVSKTTSSSIVNPEQPTPNVGLDHTTLVTDGSGVSFTESTNFPGTGIGTSAASDIFQPYSSVTTSIAPSTTSDPSLVTDNSIPTSLSSNSNPLSSGAVAGIAIGSLIVGAVLAFAAAFFLFKRRSKHREANMASKEYRSYADSTPEFDMVNQKGASGGLVGRNSPYVQVSQSPMPTTAAASIPTRAAAHESNAPNVAAFLPPAANDRAIQDRVTALFGEIHRHVETYYRDVHASITPSMKPDIARFGAHDIDMAQLLQDSSSPTTALKHALTAYVLSMTAPKEDIKEETVFPEELSNVRFNNQFNTNSDPNVAAAISLHRRLVVYLYTTPSKISNTRRSRLFQSDVREAAEHFSLTFFPWANPTSSDQDKDEDLARIISEVLETMIWLFGQPDLYVFEWEETGRRGVLISPSLLRKEAAGQGEKRVIEGVIGGA